MHILLALLGTIVTVLILLNKLADAGIDLGGLNPFLWNRRRKWRQKVTGDPVFQVEAPLEATAILMVLAARHGSAMTEEAKVRLLSLFQSEFELDPATAKSLLNASVHILNDGVSVQENIKKFLMPSREKFAPSQAKSVPELLRKAAADDSLETTQLINSVETALAPPAKDGNW